jgi:hypothetical protein
VQVLTEGLIGVGDHTVSNFDFQSLNLALNQELIELDLFYHGLAKVSDRLDRAAIAELTSKSFCSSPSPTSKPLDSPPRIATSSSSWLVSLRICSIQSRS